MSKDKEEADNDVEMDMVQIGSDDINSTNTNLEQFIEGLGELLSTNAYETTGFDANIMISKIQFLKDKLKKQKNTNTNTHEVPKIIHQTDQKYQDAINIYHELNPNENFEQRPMINIENKTYSQDEIIKIEDEWDPKVANRHGYNRLSDKKTLRNKEKIPGMTVIGQYYGAEYIKHEYDAMRFSGVGDPLNRARCIVSTEINVELTPSAMAYLSSITLKDESEKKMVDKEEKADSYAIDIIIDPHLEYPGKKCMFQYLYDCRQDDTPFTKARMDKKKMNIKLVHTLYNGWPRIYAITTRDINKGEMLLTDTCLEFVRRRAGAHYQEEIWQNLVNFFNNNLKK